MQISIIIAVFNRAALLPDLLNHWRNVDEHTKYEYELIFSDDESHDNSVDILMDCEDLPIRVLKNRHGGAAQARNHAYQYANGEIIIFTGDDIFPTPNFINEHYESYLKLGNDYATLGCIEWREGIKMNHLMKHITDIGCEQFGFVGMKPFEVIDFRHFYTSNISVSREQLLKLDNLFDHSFKKYGFEDVDLGYRLHKLGVQIVYNPNALGYHDHIYDSVEKFCRRQKSAGEELNTFKSLHPDLSADEIKVDINEFHTKFYSYASRNSHVDFVGDIGRILISFMMSCTKIFEKILTKRDSSKLKQLCSKFYAAIFSYYMYLGLAEGYIDFKPKKSNAAKRFVFRYLFFGRSQIFYDLDNNFSENNSYTFRTAGEKYNYINVIIPSEFLGRLRFDPLDQYCKLKLMDAHVCLEDGTKTPLNFCFNNAKVVHGNFYDFSNQTDPILISDPLPSTTASVEIRFAINYLLRKKISYYIKQTLRALKKGSKKAIKLYKTKGKNQNIPSVHQLQINKQVSDKKKLWITIKGPAEKDVASLVESYQKACLFLRNVHFDSSSCSSEDSLEYIYEFTNIDHSMEASQMLNSLFCLVQYHYDFVIVSDSLKEFPIINGFSLKDSTILAKSLAPYDTFIKESPSSTGRHLRIPGSKQISNEINLTLPIPNIKLLGDSELYVNQAQELLWNDHFVISEMKKTKPLVLVLPVFMAVGGVERNTIDIMERLKATYDFIVVTFERHRTEQGSLFYQVADMGIDYYDLAEISSFNHYLKLLEILKSSYKPDLLWICNSSPWMMENNNKIRRIFNDAGIIVQDVYDYEYGWIQYYNQPAIHSYDRFIAINQKIRNKFINTYGISDKDIDLVYPAVDNYKILQMSRGSYSREDELIKFNLDPNRHYFTFIGRFTEQKQPLKVLALAKHIVETYENVDFIMVGDGELSSKVSEAISKSQNLKKRIHRISYISDVPGFIRATDGLIIASIYEGLPIVTIEAMCVGTPVFSTDVGDISLFVKDQQIGLVSESQEINMLVNSFDEFYNNLDFYKNNLATKSADLIDFFSSERAAELMNQSFQKALDKYISKI
ncbi:glycosyltransferase [Paenibacillus tritici]|uniref:Glycosyltransferase n=1 Tax=Paenibacillus tritici TaxID=1873425 RepID=A0ABX2DT53_9BACL|nr:glycosyltransferase [Paenibacillus tritici]NQX47269.1 glycosyltransferase [Paenibacillus tritici]